MVVRVNRSWYSDGIYDIVELADCKFVQLCASKLHASLRHIFALDIDNLSCVGYDTVVISSPFYRFQAGIANVLSCVELYTVREFTLNSQLADTYLGKIPTQILRTGLIAKQMHVPNGAPRIQ